VDDEEFVERTHVGEVVVPSTLPLASAARFPRGRATRSSHASPCPSERGAWANLPAVGFGFGFGQELRACPPL
jgi:hypothetical protein